MIEQPITNNNQTIINSRVSIPQFLSVIIQNKIGLEEPGMEKKKLKQNVFDKIGVKLVSAIKTFQ